MITHVPNATDEPQQQEEPEPRSQAGQTAKQSVNGQRDNQDLTAPPLVSQVSPQVPTNHHAYKTTRIYTSSYKWHKIFLHFKIRQKYYFF